MARGRAVVDEVVRATTSASVIVTHGNLLALLLKSFDPQIGFAEWECLTNPDVYRVRTVGDRLPLADVERVWRD